MHSSSSIGSEHSRGYCSSRTALSESAGLCHRSPWSMFPSFHSDPPSASAVRETVYSWRPGLSNRRTNHMEQSAGQHDRCSVSFNLLSASENISLPGLVYWHHRRSVLNHSPTFSGSWSDFITSTTLKIHDWLIDINWFVPCGDIVPFCMPIIEKLIDA